MKLPHAIILLAVLLTAACSNRKTEIPGKPCVLNSDCKDPYRCFAGICHAACAEDGDCLGDALCVWNKQPAGSEQDGGETTAATTDEDPVRVCLLPVEEVCSYDSACPAPLVCGRDLHCRNECQEYIDCPGKDDKCVVAGVEVGGTREVKVCAGPDAIGPNGELESKLAGGMSGMDAGPGGDASSGDVGADASGSGDPCIETPTNDNAATATPFTPGTTLVACIGTETDVDYYELAAPEGGAGGYYQGSFTNMGNGAISFKIVNLADEGTIETLTSNTLSQARYFYFAAAPGQKYHLVVDPGIRTLFKYTLKIDYTAVMDIHEPNDTRGEAKTITREEPVMARAFAGFKASSIDAAEYWDWFRVELVAGPASIAISNLPEKVGLGLLLSNATTKVNVNGTTESSPNAGGSFTGTYTIGTAGLYDIRVAVSGALPIQSSGTSMTVPENFTKSYQLIVTQ